MAENDNTGAAGAGNEDLRVEVSTLLFELRLGIEATVIGIKRIISRPGATAVRGEMVILLRLVEQGAESLNTLDGVMETFLRRHAEEGGVNG